MESRSEPLVSVCRVERGLYVLRYLEAVERPFAVADIVPRAGSVEVVAAPGRQGMGLTGPGQACVVIAEVSSEFELRVTPSVGGGADAKFSLDLLDGGETRLGSSITFRDRRPDAFTRSDAPAPRSIEPELSVVAHVSRRGDVRVGADEWVAGPDEILPIEGLSIFTGLPDLGVRLRVQTMQGGGRWSPWYDPEQFAGSRQKADPLIGVALALTGDAASRFEMSAEVMALGLPRQVQSGQSVEFFGLDAIVGFRLGLKAATAAAASPVARPASALRVFRAKM